MKDLILPIAIVLGTAVLISISYSSIEVKGRPSVNACNGECYDDFVVADKERKALLSAQQATATPAELGSKTYTTVCLACHGDKGQGVVGPALAGRDTGYLLTALAAYKNGVDCFHRHVALTDVKIEIVEIPTAAGPIPGYFVHAQNAKSKKSPCVVYFDGLDVTKEIQYVRGVPDLIKRGISVLVMDGPGTGEAIRFRGQYLRHDYEVAGSACVDWLEKRDDVDAKKIGVVAISLGGYYAPRMASMEPRFAACIAWGAIWDYHATWKKRIEAKFKTSLSVPGHHITWILGVDTLDEALKKLEPFKLDGVVQKMKCPFLIVHGAEDEQVPLADAQALYNASGSPDKTLRVFTAEEGGAQHCQRDYLTLGVAEMWNWFEDKLLRS